MEGEVLCPSLRLVSLRAEGVRGWEKKVGEGIVVGRGGDVGDYVDVGSEEEKI